jgi:hypothetical protein
MLTEKVSYHEFESITIGLQYVFMRRGVDISEELQLWKMEVECFE